MTHCPNIANASGDSTWLSDARTQRVFAAIRTGGFEGWAVGGAVRNTLIGRSVGDIDMATDAPPDDVARLGRAAGLKVIETGIQHGTVTVVADDLPVEVTTLRTDVETDGRHATVAFTDDWAADAARRDFTINALYCNAEGEIYDPLNGYDDIAAHRVRFIGDAVDRIREDFLRILRFFRFSAIFGAGELDADGLSAVIREQRGLEKISAERISTELMKTLVAEHAQPVIETMAWTGILSSVLATAPQTARLARLIAAEQESGVTPDPVRRLAALAVYTPDDGPRLAARLRLANDERDRLEKSGDVRNFQMSKPVQMREALYRLGTDTVIDLALLKAAMDRNPSSASDPVTFARSWLIPTLPVSGADLIARGMNPGPELGKILQSIEDAWIESDFTVPREQLLANNSTTATTSQQTRSKT